jgi:hypothetical protein
MSGQLAMQENKLVMQGGQLGFCCCTTGCQWRVLWTYDCGTCDAGVYGGKGYAVGTPELNPGAAVTPGDYPDSTNEHVMRYGANPASACDTPGTGDIDTTTPPSCAPNDHPCQVDWYCTLQAFQDTSFSSTDCADCPDGSMVAIGSPSDEFLGTAGEDSPPAGCANDPSGYIDSTKECSPNDPVGTGFCYAQKFIAGPTPHCPGM